MKAIMFSLTLLFSATCFAAVPQYYYFDQSRTAVKTVYDGKGNPVGTQEYKATMVTAGVVYGRNTVTKPGKDTEVTASNYLIDNQCLKISMGKDAAGKEVFLDYRPAMNSGGSIISRIEFETTARLAGREIRVSCAITDRKVAAKTEIISSDAGTWEAVRTEYDMELRGRIFGIGIPVNVHIVEWFAPGTGIVRTDVYRRGKLHETRLLTGFMPCH